MLRPERALTARPVAPSVVAMRLRNSPCIDPAVLLSSPTKASRAFRPSRLVSIGAMAETLSRSEEHTSELQSLMRISYAVFCLKKKKQNNTKKQQAIIQNKAQTK